MSIFKSVRFAVFGALLLSSIAISAQDAPAPITLTLAGYAVPREAYGDIIPLFQSYWLEQSGQQVIVLESYQASGAQSRAVVGGFEADVVALSLEPDINRIADAGLITHDWKEEHGGFVTDSLVVLAVRPENPKAILDWADLAQPGVEIITPDPATSGGAQWNILGAYGAALRGNVAGVDATSEGAKAFIEAIVPNIAVLDRDGRESFLTFERGIGDVAITYENEVYAGLAQGGEYSIVYPTSTILIENPVALVDVNVDKHGTREVAEAFVDFLFTPEAQAVFASKGFRPVNAEIATQLGVNVEATAEPAADAPAITFPPVVDQFEISDLGGWSAARPLLFGDEGIFTLAVAGQ